MHQPKHLIMILTMLTVMGSSMLFPVSVQATGRAIFAGPLGSDRVEIAAMPRANETSTGSASSAAAIDRESHDRGSVASPTGQPAAIDGPIPVATRSSADLWDDARLVAQKDHLLLAATIAQACLNPLIKQAFDELVPYADRVMAETTDVCNFLVLDEDGKIMIHRARKGGNSRLGERLSKEELKSYANIKSPERIVLEKSRTVEFVAPICVNKTCYFGAVVVTIRRVP
jgi:hypothetical protein